MELLAQTGLTALMQWELIHLERSSTLCGLLEITPLLIKLPETSRCIYLLLSVLVKRPMLVLTYSDRTNSALLLTLHAMGKTEILSNATLHALFLRTLHLELTLSGGSGIGSIIMMLPTLHALTLSSPRLDRRHHHHPLLLQ